jgi:hypothetical protein
MTLFWCAARRDNDAKRATVDERISGVAAVMDDIVVGFENAVREPVVARVYCEMFSAG